jgi:hypothetical protein
VSDTLTNNSPRRQLALRLLVAVVLIFSCIRATRALPSWTAGKSLRLAAPSAKLGRYVELEVGKSYAKLIRQFASEIPETMVAPAPIATVPHASQTRLFVRIWPEQRRLFLRRIVAASSDPGH